MYTIKFIQVRKYFDFELETTPSVTTKPGVDRSEIQPDAKTTPGASRGERVDASESNGNQLEDSRTKLESRSKFIKEQIQKGEATKGQIAWLKSYEDNPFAPEQLHYFRQLQGDGKKLNKGQEVYIQSYESDPRAPQAIHYIRQIIADGEKKLTPYQQLLLETYEGSKIPEPNPKLQWDQVA